MNKGLFIAVAKAIGGGGSTLLKKISSSEITKKVPIKVLEEPLEQFTLLNEFYKDKARYAYPFQLQTFHTRTPLQVQAQNYTHLGITTFVERLVLDDWLVFASLLHARNEMSDLEFQTYLTYFSSNWLSNGLRYPDLYIYLKVSPEVSIERCIKRNRHEETSQMDEGLKNYLTQVVIAHDKILIPFLKGKCPVLTINGDFDFEEDKTRWDKIETCLLEITEGFKQTQQISHGQLDYIL